MGCCMLAGMFFLLVMEKSYIHASSLISRLDIWLEFRSFSCLLLDLTTTEDGG